MTLNRFASYAAIAILVPFSFVTSAQAADGKVSHTFDLGGIENVVINNAVGEIKLRTIEGTEAQVTVEFEVKGRGFFRRKPDASEQDIEIWQRGDTLSLGYKENNVNAVWTIRLPAVPSIELQQGVGAVDAVIGASNFIADLGVGDIKVTAPRDSAGHVEVSSGVGAARISGTDAVDSRRRVVSESAEAKLAGDAKIEATVGVGDVEVKLR